VPQETFGLHFEKDKSSLISNPDSKNVPVRVFTPDPCEIRKIMAANKIPGSPVHRFRIFWFFGKIIPVRTGLCIITGVKVRGHDG
jgi:hypothetical protein